MKMADYTCRYNTIYQEEQEKNEVSYKLKISTYSNDILLASRIKMGQFV
jgi:hypothetical protein